MEMVRTTTLMGAYMLDSIIMDFQVVKENSSGKMVHIIKDNLKEVINMDKDYSIRNHSWTNLNGYFMKESFMKINGKVTVR
jgi:hypothetical protein